MLHEIYYITLITLIANKISYALLENHLAVCTNFSLLLAPIAGRGNKAGGEVVLIVKTQAGMRHPIEALLAKHINYTHLIAEIDVCSSNQPFLTWLNQEVPAHLAAK